MDHDVIIIGGSFAGLSAAMQLARARKSVLVLDTAQPRNRFAASSHGFPGQDGRRPADIQADLRRELLAYPTVSHRQAEATHATRAGSGFTVTLSNGERLGAGRLVLAYGMRDTLPALAGLKERWGVSVLHCPYCHGYELGGKPVGVLALRESAVHQAMMLPDWGDTTLFTNSVLTLSDEDRAALTRRGVTIETSAVTELLGPAPALEAVRLADGRELSLAGLFIAPDSSPACGLAAQLGCETTDGPTGPYLRVDPMQATSVPGVFAAGDLASPMPNATRASAAGVMAGSAAHWSLVSDPALAGPVKG